jgi:hypothetical protein
MGFRSLVIALLAASLACAIVPPVEGGQGGEIAEEEGGGGGSPTTPPPPPCPECAPGHIYRVDTAPAVVHAGDEVVLEAFCNDAEDLLLTGGCPLSWAELSPASVKVSSYPLEVDLGDEIAFWRCRVHTQFDAVVARAMAWCQKPSY